MSKIDLVTDGDAAFVAGGLKGIKIQHDADTIIKHAYTGIENMFLQNEARFLKALDGTGFTPKFIKFDYSDAPSSLSHLIVEDLGKSEPVTDETIFRRNCALLLYTLKKHGIRHGDISTKNIIVKNNKPMLIDFHQSKFDNEPGPDKRPEGDAFNLWQAALELSPDTSRHIRKWQAIRPCIQGNSLIDFGCAEGDYLLFALTEKASWDMGRFWGMDRDVSIPKYGNDALKEVWLSGEVESSNIVWPICHGNVVSTSPIKYKTDTIFFMSVFAHIARNESYNRAEYTLMRLIEKSDQLFFETQLVGDGPGVHKTDDDVYNMLKQYGKVEKLVTIPVHGRDASRTVWRIT